MKIGSVCILMIADMFGDNPVISNASNTVSHKVAVEGCSGMSLYGGHHIQYILWLFRAVSLLYDTGTRFCDQLWDHIVNIFVTVSS